MNTLETHILDHRLDPVAAMNVLQEAGLISDNAVQPSDVADGDCVRAVKFLAQEKEWF